MRNTAETVFTGDAAGLLAEYQKLRQENIRREQELRELKAAARSAHQEEQQSLREAQRMYREVQTPLERYREKVAEIEKAYQSGAIDLETYNRQLQRQKGLLEDSHQKSSIAATAVKELAGAFMGFVGVQQVLAAVRGELEHLKKLADDARLANLDFAGVMKGTRNAFAADATLGDEQLESRLIAAARESRTSPKIFAAAMQDVFSAKGEATNEEAVQAAIAAFRLNPGDLESGRTIAARALDLRQATGSTNFLANIGFLQNLQQNARVTDLASVGKNLVPAVAGIMTRGDTAEQAGELVTTLNTLMQDAKGEMTRTASIALSGQLRDFVPQDAAAAARFSAAGSTMERLALLQQSPALAQEFLRDSSFEQAAKPFVEKMVTGAADALAVQADKQLKIRPLDAAQAVAIEQQIAQKEAGRRAQLLLIEEQAAVSREVAQLQNVSRAREGQARDIFTQAIAQTNILQDVDVPNNVAARLGFEARVALGQDPATAAATMLRYRAERFSFSDEDRSLLQQQIALLERMASGLERRQAPPPAAAQAR